MTANFSELNLTIDFLPGIPILIMSFFLLIFAFGVDTRGTRWQSLHEIIGFSPGMFLGLGIHVEGTNSEPHLGHSDCFQWRFPFQSGCELFGGPIQNILHISNL